MKQQIIFSMKAGKTREKYSYDPVSGALNHLEKKSHLVQLIGQLLPNKNFTYLVIKFKKYYPIIEI